MTETALNLRVYRIDPQEPPDTEHAWKTHDLRLEALKDALEREPGFDVREWGAAADTEHTHELAELLVVVDLAVEHVLVPGAQLLADKLVDLGVDAAIAAGAKWLFSRLRPKQKAKEILDFQIALPDGGWVQVETPERGSTVEIVMRGGGTVTIRGR